MDQTRRNVLRAGGGASLFAMLAAAGLLSPGAAQAADVSQKAFESKSLKDVLEAMGATSHTDSASIIMKAPEIAENGAVVPVGVESKIPGTESIAILIDKNPTPLAASFEIPPGTMPEVSTRVKMAQTSEVYALVKAQGKYYMAKKEIKITIGGCGG
ncbi:MAG: thiosulfate oxidation carrier protein SoxY [Burkholderiales bacterium]|nr:thiosulfate oxidation carrier protein SoxY [Burkholderiales bacterium]